MRLNQAWSGVSAQTVINRTRWSAVCVVVLMTAAALVSQTVGSPTPSRNRITQEVTSGAMVTIAGTVHPLTRRATDLGEVNSEMAMDSLTLNVSLSAAEETALDALLAAQQDPKSPQYHQWLTQEEYGARFGLTDTDLSKVTQWLTSQGFTVKGVAPSRNAIYFGGKAWQVESAFHTQLHQYKLDNETQYANATEIRVPAALGSVLLNVRGMNSFRLKPHAKLKVAPQFTYSADSYNLSPGDWATIYDVTPIYNAGYTGKGNHVGVVGQTYAPPSDIANFRNAASLDTTITYYNPVCISTSVNCTNSGAIAPTSAGDLGEADLDIEWAGGIAKEATVDFIYAAYDDPSLGVFDALQYAVQNYKIPGTSSVLPVISMSYTDCEASFSGNASYYNWVTKIGKQANSQGQTIVVASGDAGGFGCTSETYPASEGLYATVPGDSPYYTGVGGTTLNEGGSFSLYWNQTQYQVNSALSYIPETVWNDTLADSELSASGGGVSQYFGQPSWQPTPSNYSGVHGRFVPDVAFAASADHDGYMFCSSDDNSTEYGTMCADGFWSSGGTDGKAYIPIGGTSAAAPAFAGMLTLLEQMHGTGLGNINGASTGIVSNLSLYGLATTNPSIFHVIPNGNNIVPCTVATTDPGCPAAGEMGWWTTTGYNLATGLGSIDGYQLYLAMGGTPASQSSTATPTTTTYTVTPSPAAVSVSDGSSETVTLALTPTNYAGSVTLTASSNSANVSVSFGSTNSTSVSLAGGAQNPVLTITASSSAEKHAPGLPWRSGGALAFAVVLGAPFTLRRKKHAMTVLLVALTIMAAGIMMACGGGSSSSQTSKTQTPSARTYYVTVTATGSGTVTNPQPVTITVTVP